MPTLLQLPAECLLAIITRLPVLDVVCMASCCSALKQLAQDDCFWGGLAEAKWGTAVRDLKPLSEQQHQEAAGPSDDVRTEQQKDTEAAADGSWRRYCCKRMSARTIRHSPLNLLQESYPDPWHHIICCVLCSRTSGSELIRTAIAAFFVALPTPTAVLAASDGLLQDLLHPLGLQASRMAAVKSVSHNFLATDWDTPAEFHGCGKFVEDSWKIFCRGLRDTRHVADANLKAYLAWRNRQPQCNSQPATTGTRAKLLQAADKEARHKRQQLQKKQHQGGTKAGPMTSARLQQQQAQERTVREPTAPAAAVRTRSATSSRQPATRCSKPKAGAGSGQRAVAAVSSKAKGTSRNRGLGVEGVFGKQQRRRAGRTAASGQQQSVV